MGKFDKFYKKHIAKPIKKDTQYIGKNVVKPVAKDVNQVLKNVTELTNPSMLLVFAGVGLFVFMQMNKGQGVSIINQ